jgi:DNA-binding NtrC family response regulator
VRVVAATNVNVAKAVKEGRFREDLYYRLNTVQINMPPLRERGNDILLLFRKFANDFAEKYNMPVIRLDDSGKQVLISYRWPGNVRQLRNITEQVSIIEQQRDISGEILIKYLPDYKEDTHPAIMPAHQAGGNADFASEREILYKVLFDMKNDIAELKKEMKDLIGGGTSQMRDDDNGLYIQQDDYSPYVTINDKPIMQSMHPKVDSLHHDKVIDTNEITHQDSLSLTESEFNLIKKALERHSGKRKAAAQELGISERTLYRKLKEYNISR